MTSRYRVFRTTALSLLIATLATACGGGGGGGGSSSTSTTTPVANVAPTASISGPDTAEPGETVVLDGSASSDSDGSIASWEWSQVAGPAQVISGGSSNQISFSAPDVVTDTEITFVLTITDNDGASSTARFTVLVALPAGTARYTVSGTIQASAFQTLDTDTNDPYNDYLSNDTLADAQPLVSPVTVGGYVNEPGTGADGPSQVPGDIDDYFLVDLLEGQAVTLLVADNVDADADLYLYSTDGTILDYSIDTGELEQLVAPSTGEFYVNVYAFTGATNYTLAIGSQIELTSAPVRPAFEAGQAIVTYNESTPADLLTDLAPDDLAWSMGMRQRAGGARRARLLEFQQQATERAMFGAAAGRQELIADPDLRARWETLIPIKRLGRSANVKHASPNYIVKSLFTPNDPGFDAQWHYPLVNLPAAWDITTGSADVIVAVIDSGILSDHPDLQGQFVDGYDFISDISNAGDGDGIDADPYDPGNSTTGTSSYHGTHVSGTIAAAGNNGLGVAGVAYGTRIMPIRALSETGGTLYDILQAVRYAAGLANDSGQFPDQPADIINLSLGGAGYTQTAQDLYNTVYDAGIIVVAAAGNEASSLPGYPASYDGVISVSAVDPQRKIASYSNTGAYIDVAAPGGDLSVDIAGDGYPDGVLSTSAQRSAGALEYSYSFANGTSMAAPHVSGVIALMKAINPNLTPAAVDNLLASGDLTVDIGTAGRDNLYGYGLIDAYAAANAALISRGDSVDSTARIAASSNSLSFGSTQESLQLVISSSGGESAVVQNLASSESWLSVSPVDIDANGLGNYQLSADRSGLADGIYSATLTVESSANTLQIRVQLAVSVSNKSDLGTIFILLYHPASGEVVSSAAAVAEDGAYHYSLTEVPEGRYELVAGSDMDNDLYICDAGEACGAWLTIEQPSTLQVSGDLEDINFPAGYLISIPELMQAASSNAPYSEGLPREPK